MVYKCEHCGSEFETESTIQKYCSDKCRYEVMQKKEAERRKKRKEEKRGKKIKERIYGILSEK